MNLDPKEIKSQFLEWWDSSGKAFIGDRFGSDKVLEHLEEDAYWDDDALDEEQLENEELDASLFNAVLQDAPATATPAELLTCIEDRSNMVRSLLEMMPEDGDSGMPADETLRNRSGKPAERRSPAGKAGQAGQAQSGGKLQ